MCESAGEWFLALQLHRWEFCNLKNAKALSFVTVDPKFFYRMTGSASFMFPTNESFSLALTTRTVYGHPMYRRAEATLEGMVPQYAANFLSVMAPFLQFLSSFDAVPPKFSTPTRIFNIISITDHYKDGFQTSFNMQVGSIGVVRVAITTSNVPNTWGPEASVLISVQSGFDPRQLSHVVADVDFNAIASSDIPLFAYQKAPNNGGILFLPLIRNFEPSLMSPSPNPEMPQLTIRITGKGLYNEACLLDRQSWLSIEDVFQIVLAEGSYCRIQGGPSPAKMKLHCESRPTLVRVK